MSTNSFPESFAKPFPKPFPEPFPMTEEEYRDACDESGGFCLACREETQGVEPDAEGYTCEFCGAPSVMGIENMLIAGHITFTEVPE